METRKQSRGLWVLAIGLGVLMLLGQEYVMSADVRVNAGPSPIFVSPPPAVVLVPRSAVYFIPHPDVDVFFYNGHWWSPRGPQWYRAGDYGGPWNAVERRIVPYPVIDVPKAYRAVYRKEPHIPYRQWTKQHERQRNDGNRPQREDDRGDRGDNNDRKSGGNGRK